MSRHPSPRELESFLQGTLSQKALRKVVRHLARPCDLCRTLVAGPMLVMAGHEDPPDGGGRPDAYDEAIDRAFSAAVRWAEKRPVPRRRSERLIEDVLGGRKEWTDLTPEDVAALDPLTWVEVWIERCNALRFQDPGGMIRAAESACAAAHGLDIAVYGETKCFDTCALAWAELANAYRVADRLDAAERILGDAADFLAAGSGDTLLLARLAEISASLACDRRSFPMAHLAAEWARSCYLEAGDTHRAGRVLLMRSHFSACDGKPEEALGWLLEGIELLDLQRSPELGRSILQNSIQLLVRVGRFQEAQRLLWTARLHRLLPEEGLNRVRLRATEGTIWAGLDDLDRAEQAFQDAREGYEGFGRFYDAAIAGLELAKVWLRQGREAEVMPLAQELVDTFLDLDIRREAVAALMLLQEACARRILTLDLVDRVADYLRELEELPATAAAPALPEG
ncbi:MAG TPA: hypothetical protein VH394_07295 [Thermoanaerobaculia bacterium]|nr:hypothetical protein [Thermoanaerobaculia bacterium]